MDIVTNVVVFLIVWWIVLFMVLPWGVKTPSAPDAGHASSAPVKPKLLQKFLITTFISIIVWWVILQMIDAKVVIFDGA
tara:strand:- start:413 stop:649 length:237 start_codon:yes stop_codon:yes gene_type:complete